jgi:hypothetical protein
MHKNKILNVDAARGNGGRRAAAAAAASRQTRGKVYILFVYHTLQNYLSALHRKKTLRAPFLLRYHRLIYLQFRRSILLETVPVDDNL